MMKVEIENIVAKTTLSGDLDMESISSALPGSRYQKEIMDGVIYEMDDPRSNVFLMSDGTVKIHGLTSEDDVDRAIGSFVEKLASTGLNLGRSGPSQIMEVITSADIGKQAPGRIFSEFSGDGIVYDPKGLPGFILRIGNTGVTVLIFPEGKVVSKGADNIMDAVSSLEMVKKRLE
jgi:TATA-box binding protein (TBP) (component of TFIID and TFIIIB)